MLIDAHVHFWRIGYNDCVWPPRDLAAIHSDFLPGDWQRAAAPTEISSAIAVQSQPSDRDTNWLLDLAASDGRIAGVVGWADLTARAAPERVAQLAAHPKLRGLRPMLQDLPTDDWILRPAIIPAIEAMVEFGLCFDALVRPRHLPWLLRFAERHPDLSIVINHAAKPDLALGVLEPWRESMAALSKLPKVSCKVSGLLTEAGGDWRAGELDACVELLLESFGPRRLLWGSDWPVVNLAMDYAGWFRLADSLTGLEGGNHAALFGDNAARIYGLPRPPGNA